MTKPKLIVITGPTASGKSALAVTLAKRLDTEIINADSRQVFAGIPISTAVPSEEEKEGVKHHLLEFLELDRYYSAARFQADALELLDKIFKKNNTAIVCGGSMMYIDALINGIDELPNVPSAFRAQLMQEWKEKGDDWLLAYLKLTDPDYYFKVDLKNKKRVFHALEISLTAGAPYSSLLSGKENLKKELPFDVVKFCLSGNREDLFERINLRVLHMVKSGLFEEARRVYPLRHLNSLNTVGLKEIFAMFDGKMSKDETIARIQKNTRVYAKKQLTWHKRDNGINYLDFSVSRSENVEKIISLSAQNQKS